MFYDIPLINWVAFLLVNGLMLASSHRVASTLTPQANFSGTVAAGLLIYLMQATFSVLLWGVAFQSLNALYLGGFNVGLSAALLMRFRLAERPLLKGLKQGMASLFSEKDYWLYLFAGLLAVQILLNLGKVFILPVHIVDSFVYHAPPAAMWYQMGSIPLELNVPVSRINGKALGITVLMYWYFIFLKDSVLVNLPQFVMSIALIFLVYAASRQCGVSRSLSFKITALCYFLPVILLHSVTTQDHLSINTAFIAALYFMREYFRTNKIGSLIVAGIAVGMMMQFKINAVIYFPVLGLVFLYLFWKKYQIKGFLSWPVFIKPAALLGILAVVVGGYWYAKNIYVYGDVFGPLFRAGERHAYEIYESIETKKTSPVPVAQEKPAEQIPVLPAPHAVRRSSTASALGFLRTSTLVSSLKTFFPRVLDADNKYYDADLTFISGFGPQFFALGLPVLALLGLSFFIKPLRAPPRLYVLAGFAMLLLYFTLMGNPHAYRNFSFFPVLVLIYAGAVMHDWGLLKKGVVRHGLHAVMLFCMLWSAWAILPPTFANPFLFKEFVTLERAYQSPARYNRLFRFKPVVLRALDEFPKNEPIAYINSKQENTFIYPYYDAKWQRKVVYVPMLGDYFSCDLYGKCNVSAAFKQYLLEQEIFLVSTCTNLMCLLISDTEFMEIHQGLYYFMPGGGE